MRQNPYSFLCGVAAVFASFANAKPTRFEVKDAAFRNLVQFVSDATVEKTVGSSHFISGWVELDPQELSGGIKGEWEVDMRAFELGPDSRTTKFRETVLGTSEFPGAYYKVDRLDASVGEMAPGKTVSAKVSGMLTLRGVTRRHDAQIKAAYLPESEVTRKRLGGNLLKISAQMDLALTDIKFALPESLVGLVAPVFKISVDMVGTDPTSGVGSMKKRNRIFLGAVAVIAAGCSSMSSMQTGRATPEGKYRLVVAGGMLKTPESSPSDPISYPYLEGAIRYGFIKNWDVGLRYTAPGMITGDLKYTIFDGEKFAVGLGFGFGYMVVDGKDEVNSNFFTEPITEFQFPVYLSYDFTPGFGLFASPRVVIREIAQTQNLVGGAFGIRAGNYVGGMLEVSAASDLRSDYSQVQLGIAFFYGNGPNVPASGKDEAVEDGSP